MVNDDPETPESNGRRPRLTVKLAASFAGGVGYGTVYNCEIREVYEGDIGQDSLTLTVLTGDSETDEFIASHESPDEIVVEFRKRGEDESRSMMPITGFVDEDDTSWEVEDVRAASHSS